VPSEACRELERRRNREAQAARRLRATWHPRNVRQRDRDLKIECASIGGARESWTEQRAGTLTHVAASSSRQERRTDPDQSSSESLADHIGQNIDAVVALRKREWDAASASQRRFERISRFAGRPMYLIGVLCVVVVWMGFNLAAPYLHMAAFDPPPFGWLDTLLTVIALLTTTVVLIAQNRQTKMELQWSHLDLQVNLLTEQKVTKVIHLLEELRRDLPIVENRHDAQATLLQEGADTAQVISALQEGGATSEPEEPRS
jgi:uncharacterized membrane protein